MSGDEVFMVCFALFLGALLVAELVFIAVLAWIVLCKLCKRARR